MKLRTRLLLAALLAAAPILAVAADQPTTAQTSYPYANETPQERDARMAWWRDAKFGMFIHWGLYAIPADGEWHMRDQKVSVAKYEKLAGQFNPVKFDADQWMSLAHDAGMKYVVFTTKHHDGFAMFDSKASDYNVVARTPFKRDVVKEISQAAARHDLRFGTYYSAMADWHHPGGGAGGPGHWDKAQDGDPDTYLNTVAVPQVRELMTGYGPIAEMWFDTDGAPGMTPARADRFYELMKLQPGIIIDPRIGPGDFASQEQQFTAQAPLRDWEACWTVNGAWGYRPSKPKPLTELIRTFVTTVSKGGNLLLNVGPDAQGVIPVDSADRLRQMGEWIKANSESIYGTTAGPFDYTSWGRTTRKGDCLYLHVFNWPTSGELRLPAMNIKKAWLLADADKPLEVKQRAGASLVQLPAAAPDPIDTVIVLQIDGEPPRIQSLALDKPATASPDAAHASLAVDNDPDTLWNPGKNVKDGWLQVDLQKPTTFNVVRVDARAIDIKKFALQVRDGESWKTIFEDHDMRHDEYVKTFAPVTAQVVRLNITKTNGSLSLNSFELFSTD